MAETITIIVGVAIAWAALAWLFCSLFRVGPRKEPKP